MLNGSLDAGRAVRTVSAKNIWTALLVRLDHHMLRDIGLTRADVERELMKPFWRE